jgi:hypothetical protein
MKMKSFLNASLKMEAVKKSKAVPLHAMEALRGRGGISLIHDLRIRWG